MAEEQQQTETSQVAEFRAEVHEILNSKTSLDEREDKVVEVFQRYQGEEVVEESERVRLARAVQDPESDESIPTPSRTIRGGRGPDLPDLSPEGATEAGGYAPPVSRPEPGGPPSREDEQTNPEGDPPNDPSEGEEDASS